MIECTVGPTKCLVCLPPPLHSKNPESDAISAVAAERPVTLQHHSSAESSARQYRCNFRKNDDGKKSAREAQEREEI